ncbi:hypothetical protein BBP40_008282 [Aspergillus hancockii]|nr:hypothetical protein BBP40_008282 [Aspergillus hancockii]
MEMQSIDPIAKIPRNRWSPEERVLLCCLFKFFQRDMKGFKEIFNHVFRSELNQCGLTDGITTSTLNTQWVDMGRRGDLIWGDVHLSSFDDRGPWLSVLARIRESAKALGIDLLEKEADDINTSNFQFRRPADVQLTTNVQESTATASYARVADSIRLPPTVTNQYSYEDLSLCTGGRKKCFWCEKEGVKQQENAPWIPPLLYRWSNIDSQGVNSTKMFLAGLFIDELDYFAPDDIDAYEFDQHVLNHARTTKVPTPFISTYRSMLAPIHRAIKHKEGAIVTIIDSKRLQTRAFSAKQLVRKVGLKIRGYNGAGEYFIWGKVQPSAIVTSFKLSSLLQIAKEDPRFETLLQLDAIGAHEKASKPLHRALAKGPGKLDRQSGLIIGELLSLVQVPQQYFLLVAQGIAFSWRMNKEGSWQDFVEGVSNGFASQLASQGLLTSLTVTSDTAIQDILEPYESSGEDTVIDGEAVPSDDQESDDDLVTSTSCPIGLSTGPSTPYPIEIYDAEIRSWVRQEDPTTEAIILDELEVEPIDIVMTHALPNIFPSANMDNDDIDSSSSESSEDVIGMPIVPQDQFESDRARVNRFWNIV